jgi:hypothetical protein
MKNKITLSLCLLLIMATISAQSKKELDLRIDTLQTALNNERRVVQNLTLQIQNLTTELEKMNKGILLLTSQIVKQDSMNTLISSEIQVLNLKTTEVQRIQDSINRLEVTNPIVKANLKIRLFCDFENGNGNLVTRELEKDQDGNYYSLCNSGVYFNKLQIEGIGENISITIYDEQVNTNIFNKSTSIINGLLLITDKDITINNAVTITIKQGELIIIKESIVFISCM